MFSTTKRYHSPTSQNHSIQGKIEWKPRSNSSSNLIRHYPWSNQLQRRCSFSGKNQNMFAKNVMSHFIVNVLKIITKLRKEHWMNLIDNVSSVLLKILLIVTFTWFCFFYVSKCNLLMIVSIISQTYIWCDYCPKNDTRLLWINSIMESTHSLWINFPRYSINFFVYTIKHLSEKKEVFLTYLPTVL